MKCLPELSALVLDWSRVRMAKIKRMTSNSVLPGSFWCDDLTYRASTCEPGILWKPASRISRKKERYSKVAFVAIVVLVRWSSCAVLVKQCSVNLSAGGIGAEIAGLSPSAANARR
jgi:hypothetical protein